MHLSHEPVFLARVPFETLTLLPDPTQYSLGKSKVIVADNRIHHVDLRPTLVPDNKTVRRRRSCTMDNGVAAEPRIGTTNTPSRQTNCRNEAPPLFTVVSEGLPQAAVTMEEGHTGRLGTADCAEPGQVARIQQAVAAPKGTVLSGTH